MMVGKRTYPTFLSANGFRKFADYSVRIPCVIVGNLLTPKRDPVGYDKSIIDINPFNSEIIQAVGQILLEYRHIDKLAISSLEYRGETTGEHRDKSKKNGKEILRQWLVSEGRLPE